MKKKTYEVWALGYDAEQNITDEERLIYSTTNKQEAIEAAEDYASTAAGCSDEFPANVYFVGVEVETVIDRGGYSENIDTVYSTTIKLDR